MGIGCDDICHRAQQVDAVRGEPFPTITAALAMADDLPSLSGVAIDPAAADTLMRAAPIYRKACWPAHRAANRAWQASIEELIDRHGAEIRDLVVEVVWTAMAGGRLRGARVRLFRRGRRLFIDARRARRVELDPTTGVSTVWR